MSEKSFFSKFTKKQLYIFVVIGIVIVLLFAAIAISAKLKINSDQLTPEDLDRQTLIFAASTISKTIGFIIALVPCIKIFQRDLEVLKSKDKNKNSIPEDETKKED